MTSRQITNRVMLTLSEQTELCNEEQYLEVLRLLADEVEQEINLTEWKQCEGDDPEEDAFN